jgi:hypothetical protein
MEQLIQHWEVIAAVLGFLGSLIVTRESVKHMRETQSEMKAEISSLQEDSRKSIITAAIVAEALTRMNSVDDRLGRIEQWIFDGHKPRVR